MTFKARPCFKAAESIARQDRVHRRWHVIGERVAKLQSHFNQAEGDLKDILISTDKIVGRGERIEKVELASVEDARKLT